MKTEISIVLFSLSLVCTSVYAAYGNEISTSNEINVTAPEEMGMWSFGATAVLLQPSSDFYQSSYVTNQISNNNNLQSKNYNVDQDYHWWFGINVAYIFPGNSRDIALAYEGLHGTDSNSTSILDPFKAVGSELDAEGKIDNSYDAADLTFGQKLDIGTRISLHPFIGLRYAHIEVTNTDTYTFTVPIFTQILLTDASVKNEGSFDGIGPRFGSDAQINLGEGFSVRGRLGLSALIGNSNPTLNANTARLFLNTSTSSYYSDDQSSTTRVVPELDGRIGLNYTYNFDLKMALGLEIGWQATNYFNAIPDITVNSNVIRNTNLFGLQGPIDNSNFALQGPYARLQLDIV